MQEARLQSMRQFAHAYGSRYPRVLFRLVVGSRPGAVPWAFFAIFSTSFEIVVASIVAIRVFISEHSCVPLQSGPGKDKTGHMTNCTPRRKTCSWIVWILKIQFCVWLGLTLGWGVYRLTVMLSCIGLGRGLLSLGLDLVLVLSWPRSCLGLILVVSWSYLGLVSVLSRNCLGIVLVLSWSCLGLVLVLSWSCLGLVLVLSWSCLGIILVLSWWSCLVLSSLGLCLVLALSCLGLCLVLALSCLGLVLSRSLSCLGFVLVLTWPCLILSRSLSCLGLVLVLTCLV